MGNPSRSGLGNHTVNISEYFFLTVDLGGPRRLNMNIAYRNVNSDSKACEAGSKSYITRQTWIAPHHGPDADVIRRIRPF